MADGIAIIHHGTDIIANITSSTVFVETKYFDLDGYHTLQQRIGNFEKTLTGVVVEIGEGSINNVSLYVAVKQRLKDTPIFYGPYSLADGDEMTHILGVEDARFFAFRIIDVAPEAAWQIDAIELYGSVGEGRV